MSSNMLRAMSTRALLNTTNRAALRQFPHILQGPEQTRALRKHITTFSTVATRRPAAALALPALHRQQQWAAYATKIETADGKVVEDPKKPLAGERTSRGDSSVRHVFNEVGIEGKLLNKSTGDNALTSDLKTIQETFALRAVPRDALYLGLAGLLPYLATSAATVACAWDISYAEAHGNGFIISQESAEILLSYLEPIQVGYGAVILSFMGAIHWGLEWAKYGGAQGFKRYAIGIGAPAVAWPTLLLPYEYALITQFLGFTGLYYADARATSKGWTPPWYATYRFVLTFVAGASIVISLIGSGHVNDQLERRRAGLGSGGGTLKEKEEKGDKQRNRLFEEEAELNAKTVKTEKS